MAPGGSVRLKALVFGIVLSVCAVPASAAAQPERYEGRTLVDALTLLQQHGLRIVFSSAVVTRDMRVVAEPRAQDLRRVLDELVNAHGLEVKYGPGGLLLIVRGSRPDPAKSRDQKRQTPLVQVEQTASAPALAFDDHVLVIAPSVGADRELAAEGSLNSDEMRLRAGVLANDALAAVHTMPRVAPTSDFRGEFSLRGSDPQHVAVLIDGVVTPYLRHAAYGAGESASLAMVNPEIVERATLQVGAYPRRVSDAVAGQLAYTLREGSRQRTAVRGSIGAVAGALTAEGPLGTARRGSWLVAGRQSFLDWPTTSFAVEYGGMGFGFRDVQAKAAYDVSTTQHVSVTAIGGQSVADLADRAGPNDVFEARHHAALVTGLWRSIVGPASVLQQRIHVTSHELLNTDEHGSQLARGTDRTLGYRVDLMHAWPRVTLEVGGSVQRDEARHHRRSEIVAMSSFERASYGHAEWTIAPGITVAPGVRVSSSPLSDRPTISRWVNGKWRSASAWTFSVSSGVGHQFPDLASLLLAPPSPVVPARARCFDVALERSVGPFLDVQTVVFDRAERNVTDVRTPGVTLAGVSRGVEVVANLNPVRALSASIAYAFGRTRFRDDDTGETFWGDFDQRHAINAFASYTFARTTLAAAYRSGSNFPIAGAFTERGGTLFVGGRRNEVRRPMYARLDVQGNRGFSVGGRQLTLFVEAINVLNRMNYGPANGVIGPDGEATGFSERLLPRFVTAGLKVQF